MRKYRLEFEDQECGPDVPCIIEVYAANWEEACVKGQDLCLMADRAKDEGERVYKEIKQHRQRRGL